MQASGDSEDGDGEASITLSRPMPISDSSWRHIVMSWLMTQFPFLSF